MPISINHEYVFIIAAAAAVTMTACILFYIFFRNKKNGVNAEDIQALQEKLIYFNQQMFNQQSETFLKLAKSQTETTFEKANSSLEKRQETFELLLKPIKETLNTLQDQVSLVERQRISSFATLDNQLKEVVLAQKDLRFETANLVKALRTPHARGQWGEIQLKKVVEMAGMLAHVDFFEQSSTLTDNQARLRPDMIVHLPGDKKIIVDAKVPLVAYLEAIEAADDATAKGALQDMVRHIQTHIRQLSQKAYYAHFDNTPEFVVLFLPNEALFSAALTLDPSLIEIGVREKVLLATPTTLIALLRTVAYSWQQDVISENAKKIAQQGKDLYKRLYDMTSHMAKVGKNLNATNDAYNSMIGSYQQRVMPMARRFQELDQSIKIADPPLVDSKVRRLELDNYPIQEEECLP